MVPVYIAMLFGMNRSDRVGMFWGASFFLLWNIEDESSKENVAKWANIWAFVYILLSVIEIVKF